MNNKCFVIKFPNANRSKSHDTRERFRRPKSEIVFPRRKWSEDWRLGGGEKLKRMGIGKEEEEEEEEEEETNNNAHFGPGVTVWLNHS